MVFVVMREAYTSISSVEFKLEKIISMNEKFIETGENAFPGPSAQTVSTDSSASCSVKLKDDGQQGETTTEMKGSILGDGVSTYEEKVDEPTREATDSEVAANALTADGVTSGLKDGPETGATTPEVEITTSEYVPAGHFYSAVPEWETAKKDARRISERTILPGIDLNTRAQLRLLKKFRKYYKEMPWKDGIKNEKIRYTFDNNAYCYSDAIFYYSMLRLMEPKRIIEIGSGFSSALAFDVNELFFNNNIEISLIEPYPSTVYYLLFPTDIDMLRLEQKNLQEIDLDFFKRLEKNDILFVDSTHVSKLGSDVNYLIHEIFPILNKGVIIHIHDVFYPFEYPDFFIDRKLAWNEDYILHAFLQYNYGFDIIFFNTYLEDKFPDRVYSEFPLAAKNTGGSIWLRKKVKPPKK